MENNGPCVILPFNFRLKSEIKNWCQFLILVVFYHKKSENAKSKISDFTLILSTMKRKRKLSGNFSSLTMLQSVAWLSFSVFGGSLKIESWKLQSFNFCFSAKILQIVDRTTQEGASAFVRYFLLLSTFISLFV